jgi:hypothetical protein
MKAGVKCTMKTGKGVVCEKECEGPACPRHMKAYKRDNPSERLEAADTPDTLAVLKILQKMRDNPEVVDTAFMEMFVSRQMFNPAENVNKFVTGGIAEDVIAQLIQSLGFPTRNVAATRTVIDIEVDVDDQTIGISLKNSGGIDQQPILENYRGESRAEIRELPPSLIIYTETTLKRARIVYLDHAIIRKAYPDMTPAEFNATVYNKKAEEDKQSSLSFKSGFLKRFIPRLPESYIVNATFPAVIPKVEKKSITLIALDYVRQAIKASSEVEKPVATEVPEASTAATAEASTAAATE